MSFHRVIVPLAGLSSALAVAGPADNEQPAQASTTLEYIAIQGEILGDQEVSRERDNSFLQYDESTQSWTYTLRRPDGTTRTDTVRATELRPGERLDAWQDTDLATLGELSIEELEEAGHTAKSRLEQEQSIHGDAHRLTRSDNRMDANRLLAMPDMWGQTDALRSTMATVHEAFGGCELVRENRTATYSAGLTLEFRTCERYTALTTCSRTREVDTVQQALEPFTYGADNITQSLVYQFNLLEYLPAGFDLTDAVAELSWDGTVQAVELDPPWIGNGWQGTLTVMLDPEQFSCPSGCSINDPDCECTLTGTPQNYTAQVAVTIVGLRSMILSEPEGCLEASDGFCSAAWTCTDSTPREVNGVLIGPHNAGALPPLYPNGPQNVPPSSQDPFCWAATATYECPYNLGSAGCWTTPGGMTMCHDNLPGEVLPPQGGAFVSTCEAVIRPGCYVIASECAGNAKGHGDHCYVESVTYACPSEWMSENVETRERFECGNETSLRCLGDDCLPLSSLYRRGPYENQVEARAAMKALQHMSTDYTYQDDTLTSVWTMAGVPVRCRKSLGGALDNCNIVDDSLVQSYQLLTDLVARVDAGLATLSLAAADPNEPETGSAAALASAQNHRWDVVGKRALVNTEENVLGNPGASVSDLVGSAHSRVSSVWGDSAATYLYGTIGGTGVDLSRSSLYRAKVAFDLSVRENAPEDWMGTEDEYLLAVSKGLGACLHIGGMCQRNADHPLNGCAEYYDTFCCYDSHIARILHQNVAAIPGLTAGGDFGTPEEPQCPGFVSLPDGHGMNNLPLAEIIGWEAKAGLAPTADHADTRYSQVRLTGQGSLLGPNNRRTSDERTESRLQRIAIDQMRATVAGELQARGDGPVDEPEGPGEMALATRVLSARPGDRVRVSVLRTGGRGAASVRVSTSTWSGGPVMGWPALDVLLEWGDGETGAKHAVLPLPRVTTGTPAFTSSVDIQLSDPSGAALAGGGSRGRLTVVHR